MALRKPQMRWLGPALLLIGALLAGGIVGGSALSGQPTPDWFPNETLSPARVLPLVGLGIALAVLPALSALAAGLAFAAGYAIGIAEYAFWLQQIQTLPDAGRFFSLPEPISAVAVGAILLAPDRIRLWLAVPVALIMGAMLAVATRLTDPTLDHSAVIALGVSTGLWIVAATGLSVRGFHRPWFGIPIRIFGSWFLAIGLLSGGTVLVGRPATSAPTTLGPVPETERSLGAGLPGGQDPMSGGGDMDPMP